MNLRKKVLQGGAYLAVRQGLGLIIGLGGVLLLTRIIGPENYGLYSAALGIVGYMGNLTGLGINVYIVRREAEPGINVYHQAFTLMLITGVSGLLLGIAAMPLLQMWLQNPAFIPPMLIMLLTLPLTAMAGPAMARLERDLNYRLVAALELAGQLIYYGIALSLAYHGKGVWAPVMAFLTGQFFLLTGACILARLTPRPYWSMALIKEMIGYGAGYSASIWVWQLRTLVNPVIVGRYAGPEGVGYVALAIRLVEALSFIKGATWRLSIAAFGRIQGDYFRLKQALEEAMVLQVLALGPLLASFACITPWVLPVLFGERWNAVLYIYPFIAVSYLLNAVFSMHSSVLYVLQRNGEVTWFHIAHVLLFAGGTLLFLPRLGLIGYGVAELLALLSYLVIHCQIRRLFHVSYLRAWPWLISFLPLLFTSIFTLPAGLLLGVAFGVVLSMPKPRKEILEYTRVVKIRN
ncbi:MAG: oligosaccharide flippase family protein [Desulfotomaculaceae bacterium]|nr:oligosaccharide flippase family protein [Desulfotomaculaceae bacterium]